MLILLVKKFSAIIENKKADSCMNEKKSEAWLKLTSEFNSAGSDTYRSVHILKNKYLNLKKKSLKKFADEKKETYRTGGGPPIIWKDSEIDSTIKEIIGSRMTGIASRFDSELKVLQGGETISREEEVYAEPETVNVSVDHAYYTKEREAADKPNNKGDGTDFSDNPVAGTSHDGILKHPDWTKNTVDNLRTPISSKLQGLKGGRQRGNEISYIPEVIILQAIENI